MKKKNNSINDKLLLTVAEASRYTGIGVNTLRNLSDQENCDFVVFIGNRRMLKRQKLEDYINRSTYIDIK